MIGKTTSVLQINGLPENLSLTRTMCSVYGHTHLPLQDRGDFPLEPGSVDIPNEVIQASYGMLDSDVLV